MKEEFKEMVRTKNYPLEWFYKYYHSAGGKPLDIHTFYHWFQMIDLNIVIDTISKNLSLNRVFSKEGVLIAVF